MNEYQESLLQKSRLSIDAAIVLQEGYPDFAVSRAYYAMFYAAEACLQEKGLSFSSHSAVISAFGREFAKTSLVPPHLHRVLKDAADWRTDGDYTVNPGITVENAKEIITQAEEFLTEIRRYLSL